GTDLTTVHWLLRQSGVVRDGRSTRGCTADLNLAGRCSHDEFIVVKRRTKPPAKPNAAGAARSTQRSSDFFTQHPAGRYCTTCWRIAELLAAKFPPPLNVAVMLCAPTASVEMTKVA